MEANRPRVYKSLPPHFYRAEHFATMSSSPVKSSGLSDPPPGTPASAPAHENQAHISSSASASSGLSDPSPSPPSPAYGGRADVVSSSSESSGLSDPPPYPSSPSDDGHPGIFKFLSLPSEVREEVYRFTLADPESTFLTVDNTIKGDWIDLFQINKKFREEALTIFLKEGSFCVSDTTDGLYQWLQTIQESDRHLIRKLHIVLAPPQTTAIGLMLEMIMQFRRAAITVELPLKGFLLLWTPPYLTVRRGLHGFREVTANEVAPDCDRCRSLHRRRPYSQVMPENRKGVKGIAPFDFDMMELSRIIAHFRSGCPGMTECTNHRIPISATSTRSTTYTEYIPQTHFEATLHFAFTDRCYSMCAGLVEIPYEAGMSLE